MKILFQWESWDGYVVKGISVYNKKKTWFFVLSKYGFSVMLRKHIYSKNFKGANA